MDSTTIPVKIRDHTLSSRGGLAISGLIKNITRINGVNVYVGFKHFVSEFVGYESSRGL